MNIVEAYVEQFKYLNVIFTSVDYELLKEIIYNLALDFKAQFVDAYAIMTNIEDIDNERFKVQRNSHHYQDNANQKCYT